MKEAVYYEVLWYTLPKLSNYETRTFKSKKAALNFYNKHKDDVDKWEWWVTKRDEEGYVIEDIIY